ncbi:hypothetical protein BTHE68_60660 (plasmid) [Burkholderia sp. THE68]|uniref:DUF4148 domain-containing protein n=1 Tax=Burkholderiaceae TaxID=119060 RepID=UPI001316657B|nr:MULTISPECIES: DUF4148 domain-containing protein [Burkholderiaceae]BBU32332.1 hypothetical protein BTHE68_60660 [Burkholderia sp. THE68]BCQ27207.1 DUF4148 domain-containing protein [Caballeronia sp. NK8]
MRATHSAVVLAITGISFGLISQSALAQKSRQQVQQELVQAQHDGITPSTKTQYPPTDAMVARNKEVHAATTHRGEKSPATDHHDQGVSRQASATPPTTK